ncbi:hypothetical protein [Nostoc sp. T09]|uniref:hypothetical protein n=1 Tax=Nostoc sp. T09 TaxID=1932621 RepID=UPI000A37C87B|nr:hypothetical protein [Nostoc sp. T09]
MNLAIYECWHYRQGLLSEIEGLPPQQIEVKLYLRQNGNQVNGFKSSLKKGNFLALEIIIHTN